MSSLPEHSSHTEHAQTFSDAHILALSIGKPELFSELVARYQRLFVRKALSILGDEDDAYDAVQETFVRIYSAAKRFKAPSETSFKSWAYTILVNQCYTLYRGKQKHSCISLEQEPELADMIPDAQQLQERERLLDHDHILVLISRLPALLRSVVQLHFIEGKPQKEIAEIESISPEAVRARIHRAKQELRAMNMTCMS